MADGELFGITEESLGHPAVDRALKMAARCLPAPAERARRALFRLLEDIRSSAWPEVSWQFSFLTAPGFPLEFSCCSTDTGTVRYACEIAGPESDPSERLARGWELLESLRSTPVLQSRRRDLARIQASGSLFYGAWVGARHSSRKDRYKLYAEVPKDNTENGYALFRRIGGEKTLLPQRAARLRMVGYSPASDHFEFYFRIGRLTFRELGLLLRRSGLQSRESDYLNWIENTFKRPIQPNLPGSNYGFSLTVAPGEDVCDFSLFTFASSVLGSDVGIQAHLMSLAKEQGWVPRSYRAICSLPKSADPLVPKHGMICLTAPQTGPISLTVCYCPPMNHPEMDT